MRRVAPQGDGKVARLVVLRVGAPELDREVVVTGRGLAHDKNTITELLGALVGVSVWQNRADPIAGDDEVQDEEDKAIPRVDTEAANRSEDEGDHEIDRFHRHNALRAGHSRYAEGAEHLAGCDIMETLSRRFDGELLTGEAQLPSHDVEHVRERSHRHAAGNEADARSRIEDMQRATKPTLVAA